MGGLEEEDKVETGDTPDLIQRIKDEKRAFEAKFGPWRKEARENYDMVAGDGRQWDEEVRKKLEDDERPCVEFDRLGTIVDAVSGSEINNRQETAFIPRVAGNVQREGAGATRTAAAKWVRDNCDAEDEESDAFVDVLITGVGCTQTRMDYEEDEEGQIVIERKDPLRLGWDAKSNKRNNADAGCVWEECKFTREEIKAKWPDKEEDIELALGVEEDDDELQVITQEKYAGKDSQNQSKGLIDVTHFQWFTVECIYKVLTPEGQIVEIPHDRFEVYQQLYPQSQYAKIPRRKYMEAFVCGDVILEEGPLCGNAKVPATAFTFQFITGKRDRNRGYWYGLVRPGKDPQRWANKFLSQILHIINTNAKGGVLAETGAVPNQRKFEEDWAKSDAVNWVNPGKLGAIQPKQPAQIPASIFQTMEFAISSIRDCMGVNLELLGMADRQQAGVLEAQRTQSGLTILAPFFASLRHYRKRQGRVLAYFIREYISDGRLIRVAGEEMEQFVPLLKDPSDIDYDVIVDSAPTSRDTKERTWLALQPLIPAFQQQQIPLPPEIFDYLPIPTSLGQKLKQAYSQKMQQMQQGDPKQDAMFQAELANKAADTEQKESAAAANYAKAQQPGIDALVQMFGPQQPGVGPMGEHATAPSSPDSRRKDLKAPNRRRPACNRSLIRS
jgi:hypothetical protein